ncbi:MAG: hypothetical protein ABGW69_02535 [Nanoarchaeota archaeon]
MNEILEVIIAILLLTITVFPFYYYFYYHNEKNYTLEMFYYYYQLINNKRYCIIKNNCNITGLTSYNCTYNSTVIYPTNFISFYIIGNNNSYCPTLVIIDLDKFNKNTTNH